MSRAPLPPALRDVAWPSPWVATDAALEHELAREMGPGHPLADRRAVAIARRHDTDDVLFWLPDGPALLAEVHLTWRKETDARWPWTVLFESIEEWSAHDRDAREDVE